jgi:hypothetical protein
MHERQDLRCLRLSRHLPTNVSLISSLEWLYSVSIALSEARNAWALAPSTT